MYPPTARAGVSAKIGPGWTGAGGTGGAGGAPGGPLPPPPGFPPPLELSSSSPPLPPPEGRRGCLVPPFALGAGVERVPARLDIVVSSWSVVA